MASSLDKTIIKNNDYRLIFSVKDINGDVIDITGFTVKYQIKKSVKADSVLTKTTGNGVVLSNPSAGVFTVTIDADDTKFLQACSYYHEAILTDLDNKSTTLTDSEFSFGSLTLREQIAIQD
jgi:hypothetical protein